MEVIEIEIIKIPTEDLYLLCSLLLLMPGASLHVAAAGGLYQ
jgi:hypothetical protein